jgi:predicted RNase H-like nuclease (RuvC/YqgF family)
MKLDLKTCVIIGAGAVIAISLLIGGIWSSHKINSLEREVEGAKTLAAEKQTAADNLEQQANQYKAKTEYLEQQLADLQATAKKQDEELESLSKTTNSARADVDRARRVRSVATTADQLCAKLAEINHSCK